MPSNSPVPASPQELLKQAELKAEQAGPSLSHRQTWEEIARLYRQALKNGGEGVEIHQRLALALQELGDLGAAIEEARIARKLAGNDPNHTNTLAQYLCLAGREQEALPLAREATAAAPANWNFQDTLAHAAFGASHWQEAALAWQRVLAAQPNYFRDPSHIYCGEDQLRYKKALRLAGMDPEQDLPSDPFGEGKGVVTE